MKALRALGELLGLFAGFLAVVAASGYAAHAGWQWYG